MEIRSVQPAEYDAVGELTVRAYAASRQGLDDYADKMRDVAGRVAVDPTAQHRGAGAALMEACLERARSAGRQHVRLHVANLDGPAHRLYRRLGFVRAPQFDVDEPEFPVLGYVYEIAA